MNKISVYGATGFIGGTFCNLFPEEIVKIPKHQRNPESKNILYLISTTTNHNMLTNLTIDVDTNLRVLLETLEYCKIQKGLLHFRLFNLGAWLCL